jgi:NAD(P)-dependent dehydrogenase (short-subunit alcohol dehydrogenase family)
MSGLLAGKVCVISGAGPGVGRAAAITFAREGAKLVLVGRQQANLDEVAGAVAPAPVATVVADITRPDDRARVVSAAIAAHGGIDVLVNNAFATGRPAPFESAEIARGWRAAFEVNVFATLELTQAVLPVLRERGGGAVVMVGTLAARRPHAGLAGYGASKAALESATRALAAEVGVHKIRVNTVVPGHIDGPNLQHLLRAEAARDGISERDVHDRIAAEGVLGHIATSEEVADALLFFASRLSSAVTGQSLHVNAGQWFA